MLETVSSSFERLATRFFRLIHWKKTFEVDGLYERLKILPIGHLIIYVMRVMALKLSGLNLQLSGC